MRYLANAFSLNMLPSHGGSLTVRPCAAEDIPEGAISIVGHADTAALFGALLGRPVPMNRATTALAPGDELFVGQYSGPRLLEGASTLPEGASIRWLHVTLAGA